MVENQQSVISSFILRAFSLIRLSSRMAFIGIYSTETYEPLAVADREHVRVNPATIIDEDETRKLAVEIQPGQVRAIVQHIVTKDNPLTQINVANLHFVCLRIDCGCMSGMSNFNMDTKRESVPEIDQKLFSIVHKHYTSEEILEGVHALQIAAILKEDFVIIGICRAGSESSLRIIQAVFEEPEKVDSITSENCEISDLEVKRTDSNKLAESDIGRNENSNTEMNLFGESEFPEVFTPVVDNLPVDTLQAPFDTGHVELRRPGLSADERKSIRQKRETSFCEDWRSATVKSIEALRLIGPFRSEDESSDRDDRPLIDNAESIDSNSRPQSLELASQSNQEHRKSKDTHVVRRHSRATMV